MTTISDRPRTQHRQIFDIPLTTQRYCFVQAFLRSDESLKSITDFGCGTGRFLFWLKNVATLEKINFVDSDPDLLDYSLDRDLNPNLMEMLFGRQSSTLPLQVNVYHADVTIPDDRLRADVFSLIELIEHLFPRQVEFACKTIFGYYQPRYVVVTTPNREFNHLLCRDESTKDEFRHYDHKFEWTRPQFAEWALNICKQYPNYTVKFDGVGHLEGKSEPFGPCTQIAIFARQQGDVPVDSLFDKLQVTDEVFPGAYRDCDLKTSYTMPGKAACHSPNYTSQTYDWSMMDCGADTSGEDYNTDTSPE